MKIFLLHKSNKSSLRENYHNFILFYEIYNNEIYLFNRNICQSFYSEINSKQSDYKKHITLTNYWYKLFLYSLINKNI